MKYTAYVYITRDGQYYGTRTDARIPSGERSSCLYDNFTQATLFSSEEAALKHRHGIINTIISEQMHLMPISVDFTKAELFKAILTSR